MFRKIVHIDADCFYAAIEMRDDPKLRGIPMAVGGSAGSRGVVTTCNYEARAYGVRSAMPVSLAVELCPHLVIRPLNLAKYQDVAREMHSLLKNHASLVEPVSLDEAYLDVTGEGDVATSATRIAQNVRWSIQSQLGISVSAGVSVNKFVAKVASDWRKPDGLTIVPPEEVPAFVGRLPVSKIPGVGAVMTSKLFRYGLRNCSDIQQWELGQLIRRFGKFGAMLYERARGQDGRPVDGSRLRQSISVETTFPEDIATPRLALSQLEALCRKLQTRIGKAGVRDGIQKSFFKLKFSDFTVTTVERAGIGINDVDFFSLFNEAWLRRKAAFRLIGLGVRLRERWKPDELAFTFQSDHTRT